MKTLTKTTLLFFLLLLVGIQGCKKEDILPQVQVKVDSYYPNSGRGGTLVTVLGGGFGINMGEYSATFGGTKADVVSVTEERIVLRAPHNESTGNIVLNKGNVGLTVGVFTYQDLSVSQINPETAVVGDNIRIIGEGFAGESDKAKVLIGELETNIVSLSDTLIVITVQEYTVSAPVTVEVDGKSSQGPRLIVQGFYGLSPKTGGEGTRVRIKGSGFADQVGQNKVYFNGKEAQVLEASEYEVLVIAPDEVETGPVTLVTNGVELTGPEFTVVAPPTITAVTPLSGPAGTEMIITGTGFSDVVEENVVKINGQEIAVNSATATEIKLIIPGGTGNGPITLVVNDQLVEGPVFKDQALGIFSVTPNNGAAGDEVTITGAGFSTTASENEVMVNDMLFPVISSTSTTLKVLVPVGASSGVLSVRANGEEATYATPFVISGVVTLADGLSTTLSSITVVPDGTVYATDPANNHVIKIDAAGNKSVFATLNAPIGITSDQEGNLYVVENNPAWVRKITPGGVVSTVRQAVFWGGGATSIASDNSGYLYITGGAYAWDAYIKMSVTGSSSEQMWVSYLDPHHRMAIDKDGTLYASDNFTTGGKHVIGIAPKNMGISNSIGNNSSGGFADGSYTTARFSEVHSMVVNAENILLVADYGNNALRQVNLLQRQVSTIFRADKGYQDGSLVTAKFGDLTDIAVGQDGRVYILDKTNRAIRVVSY